MQVFIGIILPFLGTCLGAFLVFFMHSNFAGKMAKMLLGFAAGVMIAAAVWSLIMPAIELSSDLGRFAFFPAAVGFLIGIFVMLGLDKLITGLDIYADYTLKKGGKFRSNLLLVLAVTLHNIPEGMAVGLALASAKIDTAVMSFGAAIGLSIGIALQNIPEGAIISLPVCSNQNKKGYAFLIGVLSGVVEPISAVITFSLVRYIAPVLPYVLAFAAGTMIYVVAKELIPESQDDEFTANLSLISLAFGFVIMMIMDVALG